MELEQTVSCIQILVTSIVKKITEKRLQMLLDYYIRLHILH